MHSHRPPSPLARPGWDALLLALLVLARLRINAFAEATLFEHFQNVTTHSLLGRLLSDQAEAAFGPWFGDPIALLLAALSVGALLAYLVVDAVGTGGWGLGAGDWGMGHGEWGMGSGESGVGSGEWGMGSGGSRRRWVGVAKAALVWAIVAFTVLLPTVKLALLRHENLPHSYSHDGGVIQTEAAVDLFLAGRNPYVEDYRETPMADWGLEEFRTALDHYPYLPWTFVASAPAKLLSDATLGWYDQRFVYLLLFVAGLILATRLVPGDRPRWRLGLLMLLGLNPIMGLDLIFGQNDLFVWTWIVLAFWLLARARLPIAAPLIAAASEPTSQPHHTPTPVHRLSLLGADEPGSSSTNRLAAAASEPASQGHRSPFTDYRSPFTVHRLPLLLAAAAFGLACASKPTAWFLAPFFALLLARDRISSWRDIPRAIPIMLKRGWPALAVFVILVGPYLVWNADALVDDVWRWAAGTAETHYQIWGWGASNFVLAFGGLASRFDRWPFWMPELLVALPLLLWLGWRQTRSNSLGAASWHYALLLLGFLFVSRFLNENYLGYILAFLALGYFAVDPDGG